MSVREADQVYRVLWHSKKLRKGNQKLILKKEFLKLQNEQYDWENAGVNVGDFRKKYQNIRNN